MRLAVIGRLLVTVLLARRGLTGTPRRILQGGETLDKVQYNGRPDSPADDAFGASSVADALGSGDGSNLAATPLPKHRRAVTWVTQKDAATELVAISQPSTISDIEQLKNYVYDGNSGIKSFAYHLEMGAAPQRHPAEFPHVAPKHLLTPRAQGLGRQPGEDYSPRFHGTCTADKAVGQQYGVAKKATLVVVTIADLSVEEFTAGFQEIAIDLVAHPERRKFSVVTLSICGPRHDPEDPVLPPAMQLLKNAVQEVMDMDVPVVVAAGNGMSAAFAEMFPDNFPLVVVGANDLKINDKAPYSQLYPTLYAVGSDTTCWAESTTTPDTRLEGTSGGQIANLLSYDDVPIDTSDGKLVQSMKDYFESDRGGWDRRPHAHVLWNGVLTSS
ncbi:hypothetical protein GE09DRAFT_1262190 [Coniochaeta sp. 2T2.1]|nr:hypothetical protein GE09DRAFT_1262190 [Coniochaeta sp. 2T2.1]